MTLLGNVACLANVHGSVFYPNVSSVVALAEAQSRAEGLRLEWAEQ